MSSLVKVQMGGAVKSVTIRRSDVAKGSRGRAVLIDPNPRACYIAYDNDNKCAVLVDQEAVIKHKLVPRTYYLFLIARLNTDMKGNQISDDIVVEYLRLADNVYEEFIENYNEIENVGTVILKLESKSNGERDYSFVKPIASKEPTTDGVIAKVMNLDVEPMWSMIEASCGRSVQQYEALLLEKQKNQPVGDTSEFTAAASGTAAIGNARQGQRQLPADKPKTGFGQGAHVEDATVIEGNGFQEDPDDFEK